MLKLMCCNLKWAFLTFVLVLATVPAKAQDIGFTNLSENEVEDIIRDLSAVFTHTSVSPASSMGKIFGFQVGVVGGSVEAPGVDKLSKRFDSTSEADTLYHAGILAQITVPLGLTVEAVFFPDQDIEEVTLDHKSLAVRWTMTDTLLTLPFDLALRAHHSMSTLGYKQDIPPTSDAAVDIDTNVTGIGLVASKNFLILEPYVGFGLVEGKGEITIAGNDDFFGYTDSQTQSKDVSGTQFYAGVNAHLLILNLGLEVGKVFDSQKISAKIAFGF